MTDPTPMRIVPAEANPEMQEAILLAGKEGHYARDKWAAMIAASPSGGRVTRERLREAVLAVHDAGPLPRAEQDALAAALGLEIAGEE